MNTDPHRELTELEEYFSECARAGNAFASMVYFCAATASVLLLVAAAYHLWRLL